MKVLPSHSMRDAEVLGELPCRLPFLLHFIKRRMFKNNSREINEQDF